MIPVIVPLYTLIEQSETAANPPKYLVKLYISKIFSDIRFIYLIFDEYYLTFFLEIYKIQL